MPLSFKERRNILKNANYLDLTPYRICSEELDENGLVTVLPQKFTNKILAKLLLPRLKQKHFRIKLDELGSAVWLEIDGKKNVSQIAAVLDERFKEKIAPVYERLTKYMTSLYLQEYISFNEIKKEGE